MINSRIKRLLLSIFSPVLLAVFMTSCIKDNSIDIIEKEDSGLKGTVNVWCSDESLEILKKGASIFREKNKDVIINVTAMKEENVLKSYEEKVAAGAELPDIIEVGTDKVTYLADKYPDNFVDMKSTLGDIIDQMLAWKVEEVSIGDKMYAVPLDVNPIFMLYNKDIADKNGINPFEIKTWDEFINIGKELNENSRGATKVLALNEGLNGNLYTYMMRQLNKGIYDNEGKVALAGKDNIRVLSYIKNMYDSSIMYDTKGSSNLLEAVRSGRALAMLADARLIRYIVNDEGLSKDNWEAERLPAFEPGGKNSVSGKGAVLMTISKESTNTAALEFSRLIASDKETAIYALNNKGYISSATDFYYLPAFNGVVSNFGDRKIWRAIAEQTKEDKAIHYYGDYNIIFQQFLLEENKILYNGVPVEDTMKALQAQLEGVSID